MGANRYGRRIGTEDLSRQPSQLLGLEVKVAQGVNRLLAKDLVVYGLAPEHGDLHVAMAGVGGLGLQAGVRSCAPGGPRHLQVLDHGRVASFRWCSAEFNIDG